MELIFLFIFFVFLWGINKLYVQYRYEIDNLGDSDWQQELAEDVLEWCKEMYPVRKKLPKLILSNAKSKIIGEYIFGTNTIKIYRRHHVLRSELTNTIIHEYIHYYLITSLEKKRIYDDQLERYSYKHHPQEILCNTMAAELTKRYLNK